MVKKSLILSTLLAVILSAGLQAQGSLQLSPEARVTLLTCSPGDELYSVFGHSAIRVEDPLSGLDAVFNYGTFDFSDPNFYTNFVRGKLNYILSVSEFRHFEYDYLMEGRYIWEQELNIGSREIQHLFDSLVINSQPENRYYLYDFFFDNCATRIRDIFIEGIDREIVFNHDVLESGKSFRDLLMPYLTEKPWARLGINLALGLPSDRTATAWDYMFLPDHMMTLFEYARFKSEKADPFTPGSTLILEGRDLPTAWTGYAPLWVFIIVLLITIYVSYRDMKKGAISWWFDRVIFGVTGLLGLLIAFLWFGTDHQVTIWNLNIIWAHPFHLLIIFFMSEKHHNLIRYYFMINLPVLVLLLLSWPINPQALPWMIIPFVISMVIRSALVLKFVKPGITPSLTG